jgi:hypothetical protein
MHALAVRHFAAMGEEERESMTLSAGGISQLFDDAKLRQLGLELKQLAAPLALAPALAAPDCGRRPGTPGRTQVSFST